MQRGRKTKKLGKEWILYRSTGCSILGILDHTMYFNSRGSLIWNTDILRIRQEEENRAGTR